MIRTKRALRGPTSLVVAGLAVWLTGAAVAAELDGPASIVFDQNRVPTIVAQTEHDAIFLQGYMHAQDRLFQMDFQRRLFAGQVSEMVGPAGIPQDVQLRTLGLRRAAERSLAVQTPEVMAWLEAYSDGVNAYLLDESQPLPIEYGALEIDRAGIPLWTPLDSLTTAKGLAWNLSFDLSDIDRTLALLNFLGVCGGVGCNGLQLLNDDLWRTAPFEANLSIPPPPPPPGGGADPPAPPEDEELPSYLMDPNFESLVQGYRDTISEIPILQRALEQDQTEHGSNWWLVSGALSESGFPMIANDPHLSLGAPSTFYEVHLNVAGGMNVTGTSFPGTPGVVLGCNDTICWGAAVNGIDVTDAFQEVLLTLGPDPTQPTHTVFQGIPEPLQFIPQTFLFNVIGDGVPNNVLNAGVPADQGGVTIVVPRRNDGPIVQIQFDPTSPTPFTAISIQYVGWGPTQELETFRRFAHAGSMQDFKDALQYFDFGSQNWAYADINGNIAYYTSGELPIRQDLQTLFFPAGLQYPGLIRDGTNTAPHQWLPVTNPQPNQMLNSEILPFAEMPQIENPAAGYILNANNDPIGTTFDNVSWNQFRAGFNGLLYLSSGYATGYRIGRMQREFNDLVAGGGKVSLSELIEAQANTQLLDAEILSPYLLDAYANATAIGAPPELAAMVADPRIADAIGRLAVWDFSTPTGIDQGFDAGDNPLAPGPASAVEIDASVAATIYSVWRGQIVQRVIDGTLAGATGVCAGDGQTLCAPGSVSCDSGPGGPCIPVPLLSEFAPGSAQAMSGLRRLLDNYPVSSGVGASLLNFFVVPGVGDQVVARDIILLECLQAALDLLASDEMAPAFDNSTDLGDYRWGKLHRIVFGNFLGGPFDIPPPGSPLNVAPDLPGVATDGGMGSVDASSHSARADGLNEFMFDSGPARRKVAIMEPDGPDVLEVIPGGESGIPGSPFGVDQLFLWLVNLYHPLPVSLEDVNALAVETLNIDCGDAVVGPGEQCDDGNTDNNDGCNEQCLISPKITCQDTPLSADPLTCMADVDCGTIAFCIDPAGGAVSFSCDPGGPYGLGTTDITVQCSDGSESTVATCQATVVDDTPPSISVDVSPDTLWPPNHHMVSIAASATASDACGETTVVLQSVASDEPDDAAGNGDGHTTGDIQGADIGTADFDFDLRAERAGAGDGRTYTVTYLATDAAGNQATGDATVEVPHDQGGVTEPLMMSLEKSPNGTAVSWTPVVGAQSYNVIRAELGNIEDLGQRYDLGAVTCIESGSLDENTYGYEDPVDPAPGQVFLYVVDFDDGSNNGRAYGTESAAKPRNPSSGDCQ